MDVEQETLNLGPFQAQALQGAFAFGQIFECGKHFLGNELAIHSAQKIEGILECLQIRLLAFSFYFHLPLHEPPHHFPIVHVFLLVIAHVRGQHFHRPPLEMSFLVRIVQTQFLGEGDSQEHFGDDVQVEVQTGVFIVEDASQGEENQLFFGDSVEQRLQVELVEELKEEALDVLEVLVGLENREAFLAHNRRTGSSPAWRSFRR